MIYLLAKYTLLFLLAALLGFVFGYWYSRRKIEDVTESFEDLRQANARSDEMQWARLWKRLDAIPAPKETDLGDVYKRLDGVHTAVANLPKPEPQRSVDLGPMQSELASLRNALQSMPVVETHEPVDIAPISARLHSLEQRLEAIPQPQAVDLEPVDRRLTAIEAELHKLGKSLSRPAPARPAPQTRAGQQPRILSAALYGKKDDLQRISGVGPKLEKLLNDNGIFYFWQVASWSRRDIHLMDDRLDVFKGRISRDDWVSQAQTLRHEPGAAQMPADD